MMLSVEDLHVYYGAIHAIKGVSFQVHQGEVVTLIGANGAGKTTILQTISGLLTPRLGHIYYEGFDLTKVKPHVILHKGVAQVPEGRRVFTRLSVADNLQLGAYSRRDHAGVAADLQRMYARFPRLAERKDQLAGTLSGGEQQMLAIARALMAKPKLILMDEPSMGLAPILVQDIFRIIKEIKASGSTILLVEQNAQMALTVADRAYVLETGQVAMSGNAHAMLGDEKIKNAYLGSG